MLKNVNLLIGSVCAVLLLFSINAVDITISGSVPDIFVLGDNVIPLPTVENTSALADLRGGLSNLVVAQFNVISNDPDGFKISLDSTNGGVFVSDNASSTEISEMGVNEKMPFTINLVKVNGALNNVSDASANGINVASGAIARNSTPAFGKAFGPHNLDYQIQIDADPNPNLMKATYTDTITYTVADL